MPRIFVVSDVRLYRDGIVAVFTQSDSVQVVGAGGYVDAFEQSPDLRPDVMLFDALLIDGPAALQPLRQMMPQVKIVAFAVSDVDHSLITCVEAGVSAYVPREGSAGDLLNAVHAVLRGDFLCPPHVTTLLFGHIAALTAERVTSPAQTISLTRRESEIMPLVEQGLSNKEIAKRLQIETATVKNHIHNILEKLRVRRRGEISALMHRRSARPVAVGATLPE